MENNYAGLFLEMGLGKTRCVLSALDLTDRLESIRGKILVVAPKAVVESVWRQESEKWGFDFTFSPIVGTAAQRVAAIERDADIYLVSRDNVAWLVTTMKTWKRWPWKTLIVDELSSFKNNKAQRTKALRSVRSQLTRVWGLTGTPAPKGLIDLWPQMAILDGGQRLGKTITSYREQYFYPERSNGHIVYTWGLKPGSEDKIIGKISDIVLSMKARDHLSLPACTVNDLALDLPKPAREQYDVLKKEAVLALDGGQVVAANAAVLTSKLQQVTSGFLYYYYKDDLGVPIQSTRYETLHQAKMDALERIVDEAQGKPVLVFYHFKATLRRILERWPSNEYLISERIIDRWNRGEVPVLALHPASAGHGLNLQQGGSTIVWFDLPWSSEAYLQANARLDRQGQTKPVVIHRLVMRGTVDERICDVLDGRVSVQDALMNSLRG
jgi:SNF2 family DNA or RNA helicase